MRPSVDLEHDAVVVRAAELRRSIEVSGAVHDQTRPRVLSVGCAESQTGEGVPDAFRARDANLEHRAVTHLAQKVAFSAGAGCCIEISRAVHDQTRLRGYPVVCAAREGVQTVSLPAEV